MINGMYENALLAAAAYAEWDKSESTIKDELINVRGFTEKQYEALFGAGGQYTVAFNGYIELANGFSATIFENTQTGELTCRSLDLI